MREIGGAVFFFNASPVLRTPVIDLCSPQNPAGRGSAGAVEQLVVGTGGSGGHARHIAPAIRAAASLVGSLKRSVLRDYDRAPLCHVGRQSGSDESRCG